MAGYYGDWVKVDVKKETDEGPNSLRNVGQDATSVQK